MILVIVGPAKSASEVYVSAPRIAVPIATVPTSRPVIQGAANAQRSAVQMTNAWDARVVLEGVVLPMTEIVPRVRFAVI